MATTQAGPFTGRTAWVRSMAAPVREFLVTETGSANPENHIAWVQEFYPRLAHALHPEMVCWYAMWGGDIAEGQGDNGFGMLDRVESGSAIERPLFKALAGER